MLLRLFLRDMDAHGCIFSLHAVNGDAVCAAKFVLQALLDIADTDFPEKVGAAVLIGGQNLVCLFPGHTDTIGP